MARRPVGFGDRGSRRTDPRKRIEGGDIFQRRALKDATRALEKGIGISDRTRGALGPDANKLIDSAAERLQSSGRNVGGPFNRSSLSERLAPKLGTPSGRDAGVTSSPAFQREKERRSLLDARQSVLTRTPLTSLTRRTFGLDTGEKRKSFRDRGRAGLKNEKRMSLRDRFFNDEE